MAKTRNQGVAYRGLPTKTLYNFDDIVDLEDQGNYFQKTSMTLTQELRRVIIDENFRGCVENDCFTITNTVATGSYCYFNNVGAHITLTRAAQLFRIDQLSDTTSFCLANKNLLHVRFSLGTPLIANETLVLALLDNLGDTFDKINVVFSDKNGTHASVTLVYGNIDEGDYTVSLSDYAYGSNNLTDIYLEASSNLIRVRQDSGSWINAPVTAAYPLSSTLLFFSFYLGTTFANNVSWSLYVAKIYINTAQNVAIQ